MTAATVTELVIHAAGTPAPKGSKKCVGGRGRVKHQLVEMSPLLPAWTQAVTTAAKARVRLTGWVMLTDACQVDITARFARPASVTRPYPSTRSVGDWDKIGRAVGDCLVVAGVLADDSLIVDGRVREVYADDGLGPGVIIRVAAMTEGAVLL